METTTTPNPTPYVVTIDPREARSIVAEYATLLDAGQRAADAVAHLRFTGRGGMVTLTFPVGESGRDTTVWMIEPDPARAIQDRFFLGASK